MIHFLHIGFVSKQGFNQEMASTWKATSDWQMLHHHTRLQFYDLPLQFIECHEEINLTYRERTAEGHLWTLQMNFTAKVNAVLGCPWKISPWLVAVESWGIQLFYRKQRSPPQFSVRTMDETPHYSFERSRCSLSNSLIYINTLGMLLS